MGLFYTGVGSRSTPPAVCAYQTKLAARLRARGYILRSGGAEGSDQAFEDGAYPDCDVFVPYHGFGRGRREYILVPEDSAEWRAAEEIAKAIHPAWNAPSMLRNDRFGQRAHTRNAFQVLGMNLKSRSDFLICWAPWKEVGVSVSGGTNTAVAIALQHGIPVFNLFEGQSAIDRLVSLVAA